MEFKINLLIIYIYKLYFKVKYQSITLPVLQYISLIMLYYYLEILLLLYYLSICKYHMKWTLSSHTPTIPTSKTLTATICPLLLDRRRWGLHKLHGTPHRLGEWHCIMLWRPNSLVLISTFILTISYVMVCNPHPINYLVIWGLGWVLFVWVYISLDMIL